MIPVRKRISAIGSVAVAIRRCQEAKGNRKNNDTLMSLVDAELSLLEQEQARFEASCDVPAVD